MEEDRDNFLKLMDLYKFLKNSEEEKEKRKLVIKENIIKFMEVFLVLVRESLEFYENLKIMVKYGNKMLLLDLGILVILFYVVIESFIINVKVNLNVLRSEEFFEKIDNELNEIIEKLIKEKNVISEVIDLVIYK